MSSKNRQAIVAAVRARLEVYTQPRRPAVGSRPLNAMELLSGAEFVGGSAIEDCLAFVEPLLARGCPHRLTRPLTAALKLVTASVTLPRLRDVEDQCLRVIEFSEVGKSPVLVETLRLVEELHERCAIYAAALGCPRAAARCAVLCLRYWRRRPLDGFVDVTTYGLMRSMIDYLSVADIMEGSDGDPDPIAYIPECRFLQLGTTIDLARGVEHLFSVVHEAVDGAPVPAEPPADDLQDLATILEDRAGVVRQAPPAAAPAEDGRTYSAEDLPAAPGLVVVGDVSHVKRGAKGDDPVKDADAIVGKRLPLVAPPADLQATRAELLADCPHGQAIIDRLLRPLAAQDTVRNPPVLIIGPPGGGKTRLARRYGEVLGLQPAVYPMGGAMDAMAVAGVARGWSTGGFSAPVRELIRTRIANPLLVIDEVDKIGTSRHNGHAGDALTNQIGTETAARYRDVYLQGDVDLSRVQWILTANTLDGIPRPLLDRCLILRLDEPGPEHLRTLATSILADVRADRGLDAAWAPPFDGIEWAALEEHWPGDSLRALRRLVEAVLDARDAGPRQ